MATLAQLKSIILDASKNHYDQSFSAITLLDRINTAVSEIAAGIQMPNGDVSPPLPELFATGTVATATDAAFKALPATYQRNVIMVTDASGGQVFSAKGVDYYNFQLFLQQTPTKNLSEAGTVHTACVVGENLYYQGIPAISVNLSVLFYRKPVDMAASTSTPDGIPEHLQLRLIRHKVGYELANDMVSRDAAIIEYHRMEFYRAMIDLIDYINANSKDPAYFTQGTAVGDIQRRRK